jgi:UDP-N-acetylenolpyruvoylglucosamine reductase
LLCQFVSKANRVFGFIFFAVIFPLAVQAQTSGLICPGSKMLLSCGNNRCDAWLGENAETCPMDCSNYSVASYNFQQICTTAQKLTIPENESGMATALRAAAIEGLEVKVVGRLHSTNSVICNRGILLSTQKLTKIHGIESYNSVETVKVQAGVTMGQLTDWLDTQGKALGYTLMGFRGISVGGAIGTGAHGSSPKHASVLLSLLESIELLTDQGTRVEYNRQTTDPKVWKALNGNLGLLGVILNVRLRIRDQFALQAKVDHFSEDELLEKQGNWNLIKDCDFGQMVWFPAAGTVFRTCASEQSLKTTQLDPGARAAFVDFGVPDGLFNLAKSVVHAGSCHSNLNCQLEKLRAADLKISPPLKIQTGSREKTVFEATGRSHQMMTSELNQKSLGFTQNDWALALPVSKVDQALRAIQEKLKLHQLCLPFAGIFIRYGQADSDSWLAHSAPGKISQKGEPIAFLDMVVYSPVGISALSKSIHEVPELEIMQMLIDQFGARLHWAKNTDALIEYELRKGHLDESIQQFLDVVDAIDPQQRFKNKTSDLLRARQAAKL